MSRRETRPSSSDVIPSCAVASAPDQIVNTMVRPSGRAMGQRWSSSPFAESGRVNCASSPPAMLTCDRPCTFPVEPTISSLVVVQSAPLSAPPVRDRHRRAPVEPDLLLLAVRPRTRATGRRARRAAASRWPCPEWGGPRSGRSAWHTGSGWRPAAPPRRPGCRHPARSRPATGNCPPPGRCRCRRRGTGPRRGAGAVARRECRAANASATTATTPRPTTIGSVSLARRPPARRRRPPGAAARPRPFLRTPDSPAPRRTAPPWRSGRPAASPARSRTAASTWAGTVCRCSVSDRGVSVITRAMIACARRPGERRFAGEHLVEHAAQRVDVRPRRDLPLPHRLLGRHVVRRAEAHPRLGHPRRALGPAGARARCRSRRPARGRRGAGCSPA